MKDHKELVKIIKFCQKNGIKRLKSGDFEFEFNDAILLEPAKPRPARAEPPVPMVPEDEGAKMPPDNEMLFFASPFFDQLQTEKQADS